MYFLPEVDFDKESELVAALKAKSCALVDAPTGDLDDESPEGSITGAQMKTVEMVATAVVKAMLAGENPMLAGTAAIGEAPEEYTLVAMTTMTATMKLLQKISEAPEDVQDPDKVIGFLTKECDIDRTAAAIILSSVMEIGQSQPAKKSGCGAALPLLPILSAALVYLLG